MAEDRSKRHHYIAQFLIRHWADQSGKVWVYNKAAQKIYQTTPPNVFVENNLYAYQEGLGQPKSDEIEKGFAREEGKVSEVIQKIIDGARQKILPKLTLQELFLLPELPNVNGPGVLRSPKPG